MEPTRIRVWDLPVRLFHWLLAATFAGAWATAEAKGWHGVHLAFGYTFAGLIVFRVIWGFVGSRYARFRSFAFGPQAVLAYLRSLLTGHPEHHFGHNPAGAWAIFAMLAAGSAVAATGYLAVGEASPKLWEDLHEGIAATVLALVVVHVAGVVVASLRHRENLIAAMVSGCKKVQANPDSSAIPATQRARPIRAGSGWVRTAFAVRSLAGVCSLAAIVAAVWGGLLALPGLPPNPLASVNTAVAGATERGTKVESKRAPREHRHG